MSQTIFTKLSLLCAVLALNVLTSITYAGSSALPTPIDHSTGMNTDLVLPDLYSVVINGHIQLQLKQAEAGQPNRLQILSSPTPASPNIAPLHVSFQNGVAEFTTLQQSSWHGPFISKSEPPVVLRLTVKHLEELHINGMSSVTAANNFNAPGLHIFANTLGTVRLNGIHDLGGLDIEQASEVVLNQIHTRELHLFTQGYTSIHLAGTVQYFQVRLGGHTHLDATRLLAQVGFIQTSDQAQAWVNARNSLYAFARDESAILYYTSPHTKVEFSSESGNVLHLR